MAALLSRTQVARGFRESIRVGATSANEISRALAGQRGTRVLRDLCDRYATIPYHAAARTPNVAASKCSTTRASRRRR